jgi:hypothetical protein
MIQKSSRSLAIRSLMLVALCATLFSFSEKMGGDSFTIYLDNNLMIQQHVTREAGVKSLPLSENSDHEFLKVQYSHCGKTGNGRNLTFKDTQNKVLKTIHFPDPAEGAAAPAMACKVKDVLALQKSNGARILNVFYSSKELPEGRLLAAIVVANDKASLK